VLEYWLRLLKPKTELGVRGRAAAAFVIDFSAQGAAENRGQITDDSGWILDPRFWNLDS
jgi:hypothetical protein